MTTPATGPWSVASQVLGWSYFLAWSASFYPQAILNYRRKSVTGLSVDFLWLNLSGFTFYALYNAAFLWSPTVRDQYARRHNGSVPLVQLNDVVFGLHGVLLTMITLAQTFIYRGDPERKIPKVAIAIVPISLLVFAVLAILAATGNPGVQWIDALYFLGDLKVLITLCKYVPQVLLNRRRQCTVGWSIGNVLLDFSGGVFSVVQEILDAYISNDWTGISGNLPKFGLGFVSIAFDVAFMFQHYVLYPGREEEPEDAALEDEQALVHRGGSGDSSIVSRGDVS